MQQALGYAQSLLVPFVFTSNGDGFAFHNRLVKDGAKECILQLSEFPSPETFWQMYKQNAGIDEQQEKAVMQPYYMEREDKAPRYYQLNAINLTIDAITKGQDRVLLVMATGTGKTYTAFQIIWGNPAYGAAQPILKMSKSPARCRQTVLPLSY